MYSNSSVQQQRADVQEFFGRNVPSCVQMHEWEVRTHMTPWPSEEELMQRVIERVEIVQQEMAESHRGDSGADRVMLPQRRQRRSRWKECKCTCTTLTCGGVPVLETPRSFAPPPHGSLVRSFLE